MEAIASARLYRLLPERDTTPYSVATYRIIVRGAARVLPARMVAMMLLLRIRPGISFPLQKQLDAYIRTNEARTL